MECREHEHQLLDYAYGLLDAPETARIRTHLAACPTCANELANATGLLAKAAKFSFDQVSFQPPRVEPSKPMASYTHGWFPWAVAAAVVLTVGIAGAPIVQKYFDKTAPVDVAALNTDIDREKNNGKPPVVIPPHVNIRDTAPKEWTTASDANAAAKFRVLVIGPDKATAKADNVYSISAQDGSGQALKVRVAVLVKDAKGAVHLKASFETDKPYTLPAAAWEKFPDERLTLAVLATHPATGDKLELAIPLN